MDGREAMQGRLGRDGEWRRGKGQQWGYGGMAELVTPASQSPFTSLLRAGRLQGGLGQKPKF